jgi:hypothetical protein
MSHESCGDHSCDSKHEVFTDHLVVRLAWSMRAMSRSSASRRDGDGENAIGEVLIPSSPMFLGHVSRTSTAMSWTVDRQSGPGINKSQRARIVNNVTGVLAIACVLSLHTDIGRADRLSAVNRSRLQRRGESFCAKGVASRGVTAKQRRAIATSDNNAEQMHYDNVNLCLQ